MARPTNDRLLEGINRVDRALARVEQAERTWNDAVNTVREVRALGETIANTTKALVTDAKALLSGDLFSGSGLSAALNSMNIFPGAKSNELHKFRTFNYIFELSCLSMSDFNDPIGGYRNKSPGQVILRSGGGANPKSTTDYESRGKVEYFIDNVEIDTIMANTSLTGTTNASGIQFDVTEPLSMGLFLQSLQNAALSLGYPNYLEAPFMLTIEFVGNTDDDQITSIPIAKRYIPMKLYEAKMRVSEAGTVYGVRAYPYNHVTMADNVNKVNSSVTITVPEEGKGTVQEMLQKGDNSLTGVVNKYFQDRVRQQNNVTKEEIFIVFPKEASAAASTGSLSAIPGTDAIAGAVASPGELLGNLKNAANVTANAVGNIQSGLQAWDVDAPALRGIQEDLNNASQIADAAISTINALQNLGAQASSVLSSAIGRLGGAPAPRSASAARERAAAGDAEISAAQAAADQFQVGGVQASREGESNSLVQGDDSLNDIGKALMGFETTSPGVSPFGQVSERTNDDGTFQRGNITISSNRRTYTFPAGTKITKIIEEVIIASEYGTKFADRVDDQGMVDWFTIDPQVYLTGNAADVARGGMSKVYVYRVIPTKVHTSRFSQPTAQGQGYNRIAPNVTKVYDYIFTGKNKDILDFNIEFNMAFFTAVQADLGNNARTGSTQATPTDTSLNQQQAGGAADSQNNAGSTTVGTQVQYGRSSSGGAVETAPVRNARMFHDAIVNGEGDMVELDMTILGDPYFLSDTGMGNYTADLGPSTTVTSDGTMDYQRSEIDIVVNFRTPLDYGGPGGYMEMLEDTIPVSPFSGLYHVISVKNTFQQGEYQQELHLVRRRNQDADLTSAGGSNTLLTAPTEQPNREIDNTQGVEGASG